MRLQLQLISTRRMSLPTRTMSANFARYAQNLMDSMGSVYRNGACRGPTASDAQWYGCQSAREYTNAQFKHCQHSTTCQRKTYKLLSSTPEAVQPLSVFEEESHQHNQQQQRLYSFS
ncbi:hypothetical protein COOONC_12733 [Cooperia oncophora]